MIYLYLFGTCFHFIYVFMIIGNDYTLSITEEEHKFDVLLIIPLLE